MIDLRKKDPVADTVKDLLQKEGWDDMVKSAKEKVSSGPKPSGGSGVKQGTRYGGSKQKDEPEKKETQKEEVESIEEVSPPGFKGTVKAMKKYPGIDNPFALAWSMKKKGYKSHKKADGSPKNEEVEQIDEISSGLATSYLNKRTAQHKPNLNSPETSNRDAKVAKGISSASRREHGFGPDKSAANKVTGRFEYRKNVGATHTFNKEEVEILECEFLEENFELINEISVGAKIRAYANHSRDAYEHGDMGNDDEADRHNDRANKIIAHIEKHHGKEAVKHAERAAHSAIFGHPDHEHSGKDVLSGGLRGNKNLTKAGKVPKNTVSAMKNKIMAYGKPRNTSGPKSKLPEEVELIDETPKGDQGLSGKEKVAARAGRADHLYKSNTGNTTGGQWRGKTTPSPYKDSNVVKSGERKGLITKSAIQKTKDSIKYRLNKEELEQIDELSKSTLGSYVKGAARDMGASRSLAKDFERDAKSAKKPNTKDINTRLSNKFNKIASKRNAGIGKAVERLTREEIESVDEALKGNQHKIDKNKNNKIDAQDFRILRAKMKKEETVVEGKTPIDNNVPFEMPYNTTSSPSVKDKSGATHTPMSRVKHIAKMAMKKVKKDLGSK